MISWTSSLIYSLGVFILIHYSRLSGGAPLEGQSTGAVENDQTCDELLGKLEWKIEDIPTNASSLDDWRSSCLRSHLINVFGSFNYNRSSVDTALHQYAASGDVNAAQFLIDGLNYNVDVQNGHNETPSHFAAESGQLSALVYLIEKGANMSARDEVGDTTLHLAANNGHLDVVKYLIGEKRMKVDLKNKFGQTPLLLAVSHGKLDVVRYLAGEKRANVYVKDRFQKGLLHYAVYSGNLSVVRYLVDEAHMLPQIDELNADHHTPAMDAANYNELEILKFLVDSRHASTTIRGRDGNNMLQLAAIKGLLPIVTYLVEEKKFDVNGKNLYGKTAYDLAKQNEQSAVLEYLQKKMNL